jgi:integrase
VVKNAAEIYLSKWSERSDTRRTMRNALRRLVAVLTTDKVEPEEYPWHKLLYEDTRAIAAELTDEGFSPPTINQSLSALRGVLETAWRVGLLPDEVYRKIEIDSVPGDSERAGRALSSAEMDALYGVAQVSVPQEAAVIAALAGAGIRRVELVRLRSASFDVATGRLTVVRGKGNKRREIPVGNRWCTFLAQWKATRPKDALMFDFDVENPRRAVSYLIETLWKKHGLPSFTPHDLRRTFITHVEKAAGSAVAQQLAGHSDPKTTMLYVRVDVAREAAAVKDL